MQMQLERERERERGINQQIVKRDIKSYKNVVLKRKF
jgi:hypothetical protein